MEAYLESYNRLLNELNTTPKKREALKLSETPERFLLEKNGVKIIDIDRPAYGIVDHMINSEEKNMYEMRKKYRSLVYAYLYDMETEPTLEMINKVFNDIEGVNKKLATLDAAKDKGNIYVMLREPDVNKSITTNMKKTTQVAADTDVAAADTAAENADAADASFKKAPAKKAPAKIGKTAKDLLKQTLFTGDVSETDLKVFLFKTLKECIARPSSKNNAISKDKLIEKMLANPNLKKRLPASYRSKSKEELCKLLFPGK